MVLIQIKGDIMAKKKVKTIGYEEYLKLLGLQSIAREKIKIVQHCEEGFADILKLGSSVDDVYDRGGYLLADNLWDDFEPDLKQLLVNAGVRVLKPKKAAKKKPKKK